jgi:hypothetical protein
MIALLLVRRSFAAGICMAISICIKVYPAFLMMIPVLRRDWRCMAGCICGLVLALFAVPLFVLGPQGTVNAYKRFNEVLIRPALGLQSDPIRDRELTETGASDSQSFSQILHNLTNPDPAKRPRRLAPWVRKAHWGLGALFTVAALFAWLRARRRDAIGTVIFLGLLIVTMLPISPVCHIHYFLFAMPLVMGLFAAMWERTPFPRVEPACMVLFSVNIALNALPSLPAFESWKEFGMPLGATLLLWGAGIRELLRERPLKNAEQQAHSIQSAPA